MSGVSITIDDADVMALLRRLAGLASGPALGETMDEIGAQIQENTRERFLSKTGPDGVRWKPSYRAVLQGGQTLADAGNLRDSITRVIGLGGASVEVGTNLKYARVHQFGATITPKAAPYLVFKLADGSWVRTKKVTIPARPYLGFNATDRADVIEILNERIAEVIG
ncbi:MAG: phage virion morphogenesis protein [Geminicoccaceae bacterium]